MNKGIIYLIQPCELVGTSRYKIGCSRNPNLDRCKNGYKKIFMDKLNAISYNNNKMINNTWDRYLKEILVLNL